MVMEVLLKDGDIVTMVLEFLHSRQLYESALTLERETGILPAADEALPDHLQHLRRLSHDGEWDNVLFHLESYKELDEFNIQKLIYLILKQKYIEKLQYMSVKQTFSSRDKDALKKIEKDIKPYCSREELHRMRGLVEHYIQEPGSLAASRILCFKDIMEIMGPFFESHGSAALSGEPERWFDNQMHKPERTRLESVMTDALFFSECFRYCRDRALKTRADVEDGPSLTTQNFETHDDDPTTNAGVLFWLRSLKYDELFREHYEIEDVQVKTEPIIKRHKSRHQASNLTEASKKFSSFAEPVKTTKQSAAKAIHPSVARSMQTSRTERHRPDGHHLASSGPAHHPYHHGRNFSNNNNNVENLENLSVAAAEEADVTVVQPTYSTNPSKDKTAIAEHLGPENINHFTSNKVTEIAENTYPTTSPQGQAPLPLPEKHLRDSPNLPSTVPVQIKVESSYENFLEETKRQKSDKEQFLKQLEEKEKKNEEIRKILLEQQNKPPDIPMNVNRLESVQVTKTAEDAFASDVNGNVIPPNRNLQPFTKSAYVPIEYTEDVQAIRTVAFHPSGQVYAIGSNSKTLRICSVPRDVTSSYVGAPNDPKASQELKIRSPKASDVITKRSNLHKGSIYSTAWNDEGSLIATCSNDKLIKLLGFDILGKTLDDTPQEISLHRGIVRDITFMHENNTALASAGADAMVHITDCKYRKNIHSLAGHTDQVLALYTWHREMLASASQDKSIRLWDVRTPSCVSIIGTGGQEPSVTTSLCVDNTGHWLAMGLDNSKVGLYDLRGGKMVTEYKCHSDEVRCVRFNPVVGNVLLSSSYDGSIVLTDTEGLLSGIDPKASHEYHWKRITESRNKLIQCKWHPNGGAFASTSVDKTCKLWLRVDT